MRTDHSRPLCVLLDLVRAPGEGSEGGDRLLHDVVGWKTQPFAQGNDYVMWVGSQGPLGGVMKLPEEAAKMGTPPHWMAHVQVENVDATASLAKKLGGKVLRSRRHSDGRPLRRNRRSAGRGHSVFTPTDSDDTPRYVEGGRVLLERTPDQRQRSRRSISTRSSSAGRSFRRWIWDRWGPTASSVSETNKWAA